MILHTSYVSAFYINMLSYSINTNQTLKYYRHEIKHCVVPINNNLALRKVAENVRNG